MDQKTFTRQMRKTELSLKDIERSVKDMYEAIAEAFGLLDTALEHIYDLQDHATDVKATAKQFGMSDLADKAMEIDEMAIEAGKNASEAYALVDSMESIMRNVIK